MGDNEKTLSDNRAVLDKIYEDMAVAMQRLEMLQKDKAEIQESIDECKAKIAECKAARVSIIEAMYSAQRNITAGR